MDLSKKGLKESSTGSTSSAASAPIALSNSKDSLPTGNFTRLEALMLVGASHMATDEKLRRKVA
ncbi:hypothetical protein ABTE11_22970, partial [Acinetobacter baumannii]